MNESVVAISHDGRLLHMDAHGMTDRTRNRNKLRAALASMAAVTFAGLLAAAPPLFDAPPPPNMGGAQTNAHTGRPQVSVPPLQPPAVGIPANRPVEAPVLSPRDTRLEASLQVPNRVVPHLQIDTGNSVEFVEVQPVLRLPPIGGETYRLSDSENADRPIDVPRDPNAVTDPTPAIVETPKLTADIPVAPEPAQLYLEGIADEPRPTIEVPSNPAVPVPAQPDVARQPEVQPVTKSVTPSGTAGQHGAAKRVGEQTTSDSKSPESSANESNLSPPPLVAVPPVGGSTLDQTPTVGLGLKVPPALVPFRHAPVSNQLTPNGSLSKEPVGSGIQALPPLGQPEPRRSPPTALTDERTWVPAAATQPQIDVRPNLVTPNESHAIDQDDDLVDLPPVEDVASEPSQVATGALHRDDLANSKVAPDDGGFVIPEHGPPQIQESASDSKQNTTAPDALPMPEESPSVSSSVTDAPTADSSGDFIVETPDVRTPQFGPSATEKQGTDDTFPLPGVSPAPASPPPAADDGWPASSTGSEQPTAPQADPGAFRNGLSAHTNQSKPQTHSNPLLSESSMKRPSLNERMKMSSAVRQSQAQPQELLEFGRPLPTATSAPQRANVQPRISRNPIAGAESTLPPVVARKAEMLIQHGFSLANRDAIYAARAEFVQALRLVSQALDTRDSKRVHSDALAKGLKALNEAHDFMPQGSSLEADLDVPAIVATHSTKLVSPEEAASLPAISVVQRYYSYARDQLAAGLEHEPAGSKALYALGRIHMRLSEMKSLKRTRDGQKAVVFHHASLLVDPMNHLAANELGVLLAKAGQLEDAKEIFIKSLSYKQRPESWHNLASVHEQLQEAELARRARYEQQRLAQNVQSGAVAPVNNPGSIRWLNPEQFAQTHKESQRTPTQQVPTPAVGPPSSRPTAQPNGKTANRPAKPSQSVRIHRSIPLPAEDPATQASQRGTQSR